MKNILVMQLFRFGDVLQTTPAIAALRAVHPDARIHVLVRESFAEALRGNEDVDEIIEWNIDMLQANMNNGLPVPENMSGLRDLLVPLRARRFDFVYNLSNDMPSALIAYLLRPREIVGLAYCRDRRYRVRNDWLRYLFLTTEVRSLNTVNLAEILLRACGGDTYQAPKIAVADADRQYADRLLKSRNLTAREGLIGIQSGASKSFKRWPSHLFAETANKLLECGHSLLFFGSSDEREDVARTMGDISRSDQVLNLAGETSLSQLGAFLERCRLLVSNDTATIHVAAAVRTPCLLLTYGPTSGWETGPYSQGNFILEPHAACFPCKWSGRCESLPCRDALTVEAVLAAIECAKSDGCVLPSILHDSDLILSRSEIMPDGLLGLRPLNRPVILMRDVLRFIHRTYYLHHAIRSVGPKKMPEWRPWIDELFSWYRVSDRDALASMSAHAARDFSALWSMGDLGMRAANAVSLHAGGGRSASVAISHLMESLAKLDERVLASEENEALRVVVTAFRHGLRDMESLPVRQLAVAHRTNYWRMMEACKYMEGALREFARHSGTNKNVVAEPAMVCDSTGSPQVSAGG